MTQRIILPSAATVRQAPAEMSTPDQVRRPTVVALARRLGMSNTTFWRHFPDIAQQVADARRSTPARSPKHASPEEPEAAQQTITRLRDERALLTRDLETAVARIRDLTIENKALRQQLESTAGVATLRACGHRSSDRTGGSSPGT